MKSLQCGHVSPLGTALRPAFLALALTLTYQGLTLALEPSLAIEVLRDVIFFYTVIHRYSAE